MQVCVGKRAYIFYPGIREMIIIHKRTCTIGHEEELVE